MIRKITMAAVLTVVGLMLTTPAHAAAYLINGKWYYFSIEFSTDIYKLTGRDVKDGTKVVGEIIQTAGSTGCTNPQYKLIEGNGPTGVYTGTSLPINDDNLVKSDRTKGNIYNTQVGIPVVDPNKRLADPETGYPYLCKDAPGLPSQWYQVHWQDLNCDRGTETTYGVKCYDYNNLAVFLKYTDGTWRLSYLQGDNAGKEVSNSDYYVWINIPSSFAYHAWLVDDANPDQPYGDIYGTCQFPINPATGLPYSFSNPPENGWYKGVEYVCPQPPNLTKEQYDAIYNQYKN